MWGSDYIVIRVCQKPTFPKHCGEDTAKVTHPPHPHPPPRFAS